MSRRHTIVVAVAAVGAVALFVPTSSQAASAKKPADVKVTNLPATQKISGSVAVTNMPATQTVAGTVAVSNLPATQKVSGTVTGSLAITNTTANPVPVTVVTSAVPNPGTSFTTWVEGSYESPLKSVVALTSTNARVEVDQIIHSQAGSQQVQIDIGYVDVANASSCDTLDPASAYITAARFYAPSSGSDSLSFAHPLTIAAPASGARCLVVHTGRNGNTSEITVSGMLL